MTVFSRNNSALASGQYLVVVGFQSVGAAVIIGIDKTQNGRSQVVEGINPFTALVEGDAVDSICLDKQLDCIRRFFVHLILEHLPVGVDIFRFFTDCFFGDVNQGRQSGRRVAQDLQLRFPFFLLAAQVCRLKHNVPNRFTGCKGFHVGIVNRPAVRLDDRIF